MVGVTRNFFRGPGTGNDIVLNSFKIKVEVFDFFFVFLSTKSKCRHFKITINGGGVKKKNSVHPPPLETFKLGY